MKKYSKRQIRAVVNFEYHIRRSVNPNLSFKEIDYHLAQAAKIMKVTEKIPLADRIAILNSKD